MPFGLLCARLVDCVDKQVRMSWMSFICVWLIYYISTKRSLIAERPCDVPCQLKSCQLLHRCMNNLI